MVDMLGTFAVEAFDAELWRCELDHKSCRGPDRGGQEDFVRSSGSTLSRILESEQSGYDRCAMNARDVEAGEVIGIAHGKNDCHRHSRHA